jgi:D-glycero-alpha-D-manno-heptose-7-phosphate kinase
LGTAINKYIYLSAMRFPAELFDYSIRVAYRKVECVRHVDEIQHAPVRELLRHCGINGHIEINVTADLPSFSGLGTSSSFTVGLLKALNGYLGRHISPEVLAREAIRLERDVLKEAVGCQDQTFAAYGGFNVIEFRGDRDIHVERVLLAPARMEELDASLLLFFTGITRRATNVESTKIQNIAALHDSLCRMRGMVDEGHRILTGGGSLDAFGRLLDDTWREKRALGAGVSNADINAMYDMALAAGALGGKLLGAGGGGFLLLYVPPERQRRVREALSRFHEISFSINAPGSSIIHS